MAAAENRVGVSSLSWYPESTFRHPRTVAGRAKEVGAEFLVYAPGWVDTIIGSDTHSQLTLPVVAVENSWWEDRRVERKTSLPTLKATPSKYIFSLGFPFSPLKHPQKVTEKTLLALPEAFLIRRWPIISPDLIEDPARADLIARRNEALFEYPFHKREILDVHSINQRLTPDEYLEWLREEGFERRLMFTFPDERLPQHGIPESTQVELLKPLLPYVSAVTLKVADLYDTDGNLQLSEVGLIKTVVEGDVESVYAQRLRDTLSQVGTETDDIDLIIKIKGDFSTKGVLDEEVSKDEFIKTYVGWVREVASTV